MTTNAAATVCVAVPIQLSYEFETINGSRQLHIIGPPASGFTIEATGDLLNWTPIYTNSATTTAPIDYRDPATNLPRRFYRVPPSP